MANLLIQHQGSCLPLKRPVTSSNSISPFSLLQDEYHPCKGSLHYEEDNFRVLTLALGRIEGPDLEKESSHWQPEEEPEENSAERLEEEQMLEHLRGLTGVEEVGGNLPLRYDPEQDMTKREKPEADQETTQEAICGGTASSHHASGGAWLHQVCGRERGLGNTLVAIQPPQ
ncbi:hypothetical protein NDU88_007466 [Pleurodeles waltl]|uniref:Uncharacterized protein n=1 Tax=Pleurodeles waltl TaxID=8319 RepID=A0AAV7N3I6_PLEWA|nr:hypothetical protein NDU88_007466 [Pleurodeles waltl]